jgi:hypothetical protein
MPKIDKILKKGGDGSLTPYVAAKPPGTEKEPNWLPNRHFSLYIRAYWASEAFSMALGSRSFAKSTKGYD